MTRWPLVAVLALVGCGAAADAEPVAFGEVCGVAGPFRLTDDPKRWLSGALDGRLIYGTARVSQDVGSDLWSSGPCGESPRKLASDIGFVIQDERWPNVLLACRHQAVDIVSVDPAGIEPPNVVFTNTGCSPSLPQDGFLRREGTAAEPGPLLWQPFPKDLRRETSEPVVLLDEVALNTRVWLQGGLAFLLTADGTLSSLVLPDGEPTLEFTGMQDLQMSGDARYMLWHQRPQSGEEDPDHAGPVFFHDRTTGTGTLLTSASFKSNWTPPLRWVDAGIITLTRPVGLIRVFFLPAMDSVDLPYGLIPHAPIGDGRWLLTSFVDYSLHLGDLRDPAAITMIFPEASVVALEPGGVTVLNMPSQGLGGGPDQADSEMWFLPFDGSPPRLLAERMSHLGRRLADGRWLATVANDELWTGDLVLVDPTTRDELLIEPQVQGYGRFPLLGDDVIFYRVTDGERAGIWLARLPPAG